MGRAKTTAALLTAMELTERGKSVTIIDADPQRWITQWAKMPGKPRTISIVDQVTAGSISSILDEERTRSDYIIIDLEGTMSQLVGNAVALSDMVLIPIQGCAMDAKGGGKILDLIAGIERSERRTIRHSVILTRINAAVTTRALRAVQDHLIANKIDVMTTAIVERSAYRDIFETGGMLSDLDRTKVSNLDKALENMRQLVGEIAARLPAAKRQPKRLSGLAALWRRAA